jgi:hypothetical protein
MPIMLINSSEIIFFMKWFLSDCRTKRRELQMADLVQGT